MHRSYKVITNTSGDRQAVALEPWGMTLQLEPAESFELEAESQRPGELQIEHTDQIVVYAWPGATLRVHQHGKLLHEQSEQVPELPANLSTRDFMDVTGLNKVK